MDIIFFAKYLEFFATYMPYSVETSLAENFINFGQNAESSYKEAASELQDLALELAKNMNAPNDMPLL
ncbi:MAG: hypothetical protein LBG21_02020 [Campylobacteraceae bacterium]|jgi:hypothetical protein|nr:hypothetical protein [Campylobacteraceae bacterium]